MSGISQWPVQNRLLFSRSHPSSTKPAPLPTSASGTTIHLIAWPRNFVLILDSSFSRLTFSQQILSALPSKNIPSQITPPDRHHDHPCHHRLSPTYALVSYMVSSASPCTSHGETPANTAREWGLEELKANILSSRPGLLNLGIIDIWSQTLPCGEQALSCTLQEILAAFLLSTREMPVAYLPPHPK